jgi:RloB-like protein
VALKREPLRRRRGTPREPRRRILVVCGADKTESAYFKGLCASRRGTSVNVVIAEKGHSAPDQVVQFARRKMASGDFDQIWCVVDVDDFERDGGKISAAVRLGTRHGIELAVSNPCFELWLLLHHVECMSHCANCRVVEGLLKRQVPAYEKTNLIFKDFAGYVPRAVERARKLEPSGTDHLADPSTGVWRLVATIMEQS